MPRIGRRTTLAATACLAAMPALAQGEAYPSRTIRLIVPRAPGGGSDILARLIAPGLTQRLGQNVVVENRPDATAVIGAELVARSRPDGHTILLTDNSFYQNPAILPHLSYDTVRDFLGITMLAEAPVVLILNPRVPATSLRALLDHARANPGRLTYASGGVGASTHFAGVLMNLRAGTRMTHVPFRSSGDAINALLSGQVDMQFGGLSSARQLIEGGQVRAVGLTGSQRAPAMPQIPTFTEAGLAGADVTSVWGLHVPAGTPMPIRQRLRDEAVATMRDQPLAARLTELGYVPIGNAPDEHQRQTEEILALWREVGRTVNLNE